jgi:hypothetical protein
MNRQESPSVLRRGVCQNQACCYALLGFADLALDNLQLALEFMPNLYRELALTDSDLRGLRKQQRFEALIRG